MELKEPGGTAGGRGRLRRAAALLAAVAVLGSGCAQASAAPVPAPAPAPTVPAWAFAPAPARAAAPAAAGARAAARPPRAGNRAHPRTAAVASRAVASRAVAPSAVAPSAVAPSAAAPRVPLAPARRRARHGAARRPVARATGPNAAGRCPTTLGRIACVDLTRQLMWVQVGGRVVFGPVRVRTGRAHYVTRTGLWHVYRRNRDQWSTLYDVAMPYSQFFSGGEAFHGLDGESMYSPPGSHGCVNMNTWDARTLWGILRSGDPVEVFGRKPGT